MRYHLILIISTLIFTSCQMNETHESKLTVKYEYTYRILPDSLSSPFINPSFNNNSSNFWLDTEFLKIKNKLWKDTSLLYPLSDFDKVICFKYKEPIEFGTQNILDDEGYISDQVELPGYTLTELQSELLVNIINDTASYDRNLYNSLFDPIKILGFLFVKHDNKVIGTIDIFKDHIEMLPVIPRAGYSALRMNNDRLLEIQRIVKYK